MWPASNVWKSLPSTLMKQAAYNMEKVPGSEHIIECDTVIFTVGQRAGLAFIPDDAGVGMTAQTNHRHQSQHIGRDPRGRLCRRGLPYPAHPLSSRRWPAGTQPPNPSFVICRGSIWNRRRNQTCPSYTSARRNLTSAWRAAKSNDKPRVPMPWLSGRGTYQQFCRSGRRL